MNQYQPFITTLIIVLSGLIGTGVTLWIQRARDHSKTQNEQDANAISWARELRERLESLESRVTQKDSQIQQLQNANAALETRSTALMNANTALQTEITGLRYAYQNLIERYEVVIAQLRKMGGTPPMVAYDPLGVATLSIPVGLVGTDTGKTNNPTPDTGLTSTNPPPDQPTA